MDMLFRSIANSERQPTQIWVAQIWSVSERRILSHSADRLYPMLIDCEFCRARDTGACEDCVVNVLFTEGIVDLDPAERGALANLAGVGLVPPLRLVLSDEQASSF